MPKSLALSFYLSVLARGRLGRLGASLRPARAIAAPENAPAREGIYPPLAPADGPLIWVHTAQTASLAPVAEMITSMADQRPELRFLITVTDASDPCIAALDLPAQTTILPTPDDTRLACARFFTHWAPALAIWIGLDLRPSLIFEASARSIPLFSIDGPRANESAPVWRWQPGMRRALLARFQRSLVGDQTSYARRLRLGAPSWTLEEVGFLELGASALPCNENELADMIDQIGARPVWLAAGLGEAEEQDILNAHRTAMRRAHRLLLILVPQDPSRGPRIAQRAAEMGLVPFVRSADDLIEDECAVYIADTEDEIGLWYRIAPVSFLGGSFAGKSSHNPYEAAALGSAVVHGPNVAQFRSAYSRLATAGATTMVRSEAELAHAIEMLQAPDRVAEINLAAWEVCSSGAKAANRITELAFATLDAKRPR
ncbi:MAG: 3-deoxy-D-manno-octulosonic acid transferase [Paracoccaceae bacterium]